MNTLSCQALCSDHYINMRVHLKMDLSMRRDTVLNLFDRMRKERPDLNRFRRYQNELALESEFKERSQQWLAVRRTSIRSGAVNPEESTDAYDLHRLVLEVAPYFLDISPIDIDYIELLFGFDLPATGNHDAITFDAFFSDSPLAAILQQGTARVVDCQPLVGVALNDGCDLQAHLEVKTRTSAHEVRMQQFREEAISTYLTMRKYGPLSDLSELPDSMKALTARGEELIDSTILPHVISPLRDAIAASGW